MTKVKRSISRVFGICLALGLLSGCAGNAKFDYDEQAVSKVKKVAVLIYSVPPTIKYRSDPQKIEETGLLGSLVNAATSNNGGQAATLAEKSFIQTINASGLHFKVLTRDEMLANAAYQKVAQKYYALTQVVEEEPEQSAMEMAGDFFGLTKKKAPTSLDAVGAEGQPSYGLPISWQAATTALMGTAEEKAYIQESIQALGVDAAIIINDWGMAFSCDACLGGTGTGSTSTAFLLSMVNNKGESVLDMNQWFVSSDNTAPMVAYIVNPFQHDSLFQGHGSKMATVFVDYYKENGGK